MWSVCHVWFSVIHIWISEFECVLVMISSFHLHLEAGRSFAHTHIHKTRWFPLITYNACRMYPLRCFKRFLYRVFVRIVWCWSCCCQFELVGYNFFCAPLLHTFSIVHSIRHYHWVCAARASLPCFAIIQRLNSTMRFPYFHLFGETFSLALCQAPRTGLSLFWFAIECSSLMSFCPARIRAIWDKNHTCLSI